LLASSSCFTLTVAALTSPQADTTELAGFSKLMEAELV
jgi:hypothetical protein